MQEFVVLSILAGAGWAVTNVIDDAVIRIWELEEFVSVALMSGLSRIFLVPLFLLLGTLEIPGGTSVIISIIVGGLFFTGTYFYYVALDIGEIVGLSVFSESGPIIVLFGSILLGATLSILDIIGVVIIVFGAILVSVRIKKLGEIGFRKETAWIIAATVCFAFVSLLSDLVASNFNSQLAQISWVWMGTAFSTILYLSVEQLRSDSSGLTKLKAGLKSDYRVPLLLTIAIIPETTAYIVFFEAIEIGEVAVSSALSSFRPLFVLVFTLMIPSADTRNLSYRHIFILIIATILMIIGGYLTQATT